MKTSKFTSYPFATCPYCKSVPSYCKTIKDENYFEHNIQWQIKQCMDCGKEFKAE